ncbi:MAG: T9SS type A sorting domain-containing protein [Sphingobacteriales bacterium]|nr:MAG: T9SS type A sorting domain-containing protein [Sphingobacteriales bacterium]
MKKPFNLSNLMWAACFSLFPAGSIYAQVNTSLAGVKTESLGQRSKFDQRWQKGGVFEGYSPDQEVLEKRSRTTKHFGNQNGSGTAQIMTAGIHYRDENGAWQDRDMTIVQNVTGNSPYKFVNITNDVKSYFPTVSGNTPLRLKSENGKLFEWWKKPSLSYIDVNGIAKKYEARAVSATLISGGTQLHYTGIYPGITEEFTLVNGGVENNTIIHALNADINALSDKGLVSFAQFIPLEKGWQLLDNLGKVIKSNTEVAAFSVRVPGMDQLVNFGRIVAFDHHLNKEKALGILALPDEKRSAADQELLANNIYVGQFNIKFVPGGIELISQVPAKWLQASGRAFPVTIDPTVTIGTTTGGSTTYSTLVQLWGYHRNAELYLQSEIGTYGSITGIEYYKSGTQASRTKPTKVWMRTSSSVTLPAAPGAAWNSTTFTGGLTTLFDGNTTQDNAVGWKMITLTTPFNYSADNLVIMVKNDYGGSGSSQSIAGNQSITNRSAYLTADGTDPSDASSAQTNGTLVKLSDIRITYTTSGPVCAAPAAPSAGSVTATTAVLNWTQTGTPAQWQIKYGTTGFNVNTGGTAILTATKPYTLNPPLSPATTYDYYVRAICGPNDTSAWSPVTTFVTLAPACAAPTAPTAGSVTATTAQLNWTQSGTPAQWQIKYGATGFNVNTGGTAILTATKPYTLNPPLSAMTTYDYYVRAICGPNDTSAWAPVTTFTTLCATPGILTHPDSSRCGTGTVVLNATATAGATVQWYAAAAGGTALASGNTFTTPSLSATTSYYITAKIGTCESSPRQEVIATIRQAATVDTITANLANAPTVAFQAVNPQHVTTYAWSFGSGGGTANQQNPTYVYPTVSTAQNYTVTLIVSNDCGQDTVTKLITVPGSTGLNDLNVNNDNLKLYPNPTAQYFKLENNTPYKLKQLSIINVLGQTIRSISLNGPAVQAIDVSNLASGIYNVRVEFEEGAVIRKLEILK